MSAVIDAPATVIVDPQGTVDDLQIRQRSLAVLAQILRVVGALAIVGSMSAFLLQGWSVGNDVQRYLLLLAQTALLTGAGFALSHGLKETRGARVFFGLALVSVPANFTILGALMYSAFQLDGAMGQYPSFASWQVVDAASASITLLGALVALVPLSLLCFAIMARRSAQALTLHLLVLNSLLLIPARSATSVGVMVLIGVAYALWATARLIRRNGALATPEGRFALSVLFAPLIIVVVRSLNFYPVSATLLALLCVSAFLVLRHVSLWAQSRRNLSVGLDALSLPIAIGAASLVEVALQNAFGNMPISPVFALTLGLLGWDVIRRTASRPLAGIVGLIVSALIAMSLLVNLYVEDSVGYALICVVAGLVAVLSGYFVNHKGVLFIGVITSVLGLASGAEDLTAMVLNSGWVELLIGGATIIAMASVVERHGVTLRLKIKQWAETARRRRSRVLADT